MNLEQWEQYLEQQRREEKIKRAQWRQEKDAEYREVLRRSGYDDALPYTVINSDAVVVARFRFRKDAVPFCRKNYGCCVYKRDRLVFFDGGSVARPTIDSYTQLVIAAGGG
jgi:hypothetical protein